MAKLLVREGKNAGTAYIIPPGRTLVILGRRKESDIQVLDNQASRSHAEIRRVEGRFMIRDLGSANGTYFKNMKLVGTIELRPESKFRIGGTVYQFFPDPGEIPDQAMRMRADALEILPPEAIAQQRKRAKAMAAANEQGVDVNGSTPLQSPINALETPSKSDQSDEPPQP
jgi:predicted component of type VI protein secretion system